MNNSEKRNKSASTKSKRTTIVKFSEDCNFFEENNDFINANNNSKNKTLQIRPKIDKKFKHLNTVTNQKIKIKGTTQRVPKNLMKKDDIKIRNALDDIQPRGATFFKIGFNSDERKQKQRKLFRDYYNIPMNQLKGTLTVGQLWSNKDKTNYLQENKIYINKVKLLEKMATFKRENEKNLRLMKRYSDNPSGSCKSMESDFLCTMKTIKSNGQDSNRCSKSKLVSDLYSLRKDISELHKSTQGDKTGKIFKQLQICNHNFHKMQEKYFLTLLDM